MKKQWIRNLVEVIISVCVLVLGFVWRGLQVFMNAQASTENVTLIQDSFVKMEKLEFSGNILMFLYQSVLRFVFSFLGNQSIYAAYVSFALLVLAGVFMFFAIKHVVNYEGAILFGICYGFLPMLDMLFTTQSLRSMFLFLTCFGFFILSFLVFGGRKSGAKVFFVISISVLILLFAIPIVLGLFYNFVNVPEEWINNLLQYPFILRVIALFGDAAISFYMAFAGAGVLIGEMVNLVIRLITGVKPQHSELITVSDIMMNRDLDDSEDEPFELKPVRAEFVEEEPLVTVSEVVSPRKQVVLEYDLKVNDSDDYDLLVSDNDDFDILVQF